MELDIHIPHPLRFTEGKGYVGIGWSSCSPIFHMLGQKIFLLFRTMFKLHKCVLLIHEFKFQSTLRERHSYFNEQISDSRARSVELYNITFAQYSCTNEGGKLRLGHEA